jgi:hypothetical protein
MGRASGSFSCCRSVSPRDGGNAWRNVRRHQRADASPLRPAFVRAATWRSARRHSRVGLGAACGVGPGSLLVDLSVGCHPGEEVTLRASSETVEVRRRFESPRRSGGCVCDPAGPWGGGRRGAGWRPSGPCADATSRPRESAKSSAAWSRTMMGLTPAGAL